MTHSSFNLMSSNCLKSHEYSSTCSSPFLYLAVFSFLTVEQGCMTIFMFKLTKEAYKNVMAKTYILQLNEFVTQIRSVKYEDQCCSLILADYSAPII